MKPLNILHRALLVIFALINAVILYLFLLQFPYGLEPFLISIANWEKLSPQVEWAAAIAVSAAILVGIFAWRLDSTWKNRLLYFRWLFPHPSFNAFLTTRRQPFESKELLAAFPQVKDSGFSAKFQTETWSRLYQKNAQELVVLNTRIYWEMLRDLYTLSFFFLLLFVSAWVVNPRVPFAIVSVYVFMFGAQFLFLMLMARRIGFKLVDNVLGVELGLSK